MRSKTLVQTIVAAVVVAAYAAAATAQRTGGGDDLDARARAIHARVLVLDCHTDVLLDSTPPQYFAPGRTSRTGIERLRQGGIGAIAMAIAVGPGPRTTAGVTAARAEADEKLAAIKAFVQTHGDRVALAQTAGDIERIHASGKVAVIPSFLNARSLGTDVAAIDRFYREGVRLLGLTHAGHNDFADSSRPGDGPASEHGGLSSLGRDAVTRLNRLGIVVDVSQLTPAGVRQVLALTKAPVVASHSNVRALVDNTRNLSDSELDGIKANGGVVHVTPFNTYLRSIPEDFDRQLAQVRQQFGLPAAVGRGTAAINEGIDTLPADRAAQYESRARALAPRANVADLVNHIDYLVKRIGVDHVGIGTDFNHGSGIDGFDSEAEAPNVTRELVRRGYSETQIRKIWGGNFLRVFREVEAAARRLRQSP